MHIKLILPTCYDENERLIKPSQAVVPNLAIRYLATMVPDRHMVSVMEESMEDVDFNEDVDLVGISVNTANAFRAYEIADRFRAGNVKVVLGGIHVTAVPDEAARHADAMVLGEAEDSWPQLLEDFENGRMKPRYAAPRRESLEGLPLPRMDLMDRSKYLTFPSEKYPLLPIQTSRGCPYNCEFCTVTWFWGNPIRYRPIEEVIEEIKQTGAKSFFFIDDNIASNEARAEELFKALIPLKIKYICMMDSLIYRKPELVKLAAKSGCYIAYIGFESLSDESLKGVKKHFNKPGIYEKVFKVFSDAGINVYSSFIYGFDSDTPELVDRTINLLINQKCALCASFPLCPFPGTDMYERFKAQGKLKVNEWWLRKNYLVDSFSIKYENENCSGIALSSLAAQKFYTLPSVLKRFSFRRKHWPFILLANLMMRSRINKSIAADGKGVFHGG